MIDDEVLFERIPLTQAENLANIMGMFGRKERIAIVLYRGVPSNVIKSFTFAYDPVTMKIEANAFKMEIGDDVKKAARDVKREIPCDYVALMDVSILSEVERVISEEYQVGAENFIKVMLKVKDWVLGSKMFHMYPKHPLLIAAKPLKFWHLKRLINSIGDGYIFVCFSKNKRLLACPVIGIRKGRIHHITALRFRGARELQEEIGKMGNLKLGVLIDVGKLESGGFSALGCVKFGPIPWEVIPQLLLVGFDYLLSFL